MGPSDELSLGEPEGDLLVSCLDGIGAVDDVATDVDAEVAADGARLRVEGLGGAEHLAAGGDSLVTLPDHGADGAGGGVVAQATEEGPRGEVGVVLLEVSAAWGAQLHGNELEALGLEAGDDLANESSLDTIGLDHDEGSFLGGSVDHSVKVLQRI